MTRRHATSWRWAGPVTKRTTPATETARRVERRRSTLLAHARAGAVRRGTARYDDATRCRPRSARGDDEREGAVSVRASAPRRRPLTLWAASAASDHSRPSPFTSLTIAPSSPDSSSKTRCFDFTTTAKTTAHDASRNSSRMKSCPDSNSIDGSADRRTWSFGSPSAS